VIPAHSDVHSTLPVAEELIARGDQVTFYLTEEFAPTVRRIGAGFRPLDPAVDLYHQLSAGNPLTSMADVGAVIERMGPVVAELLVAGLRAVPGMLAAVRAENADLIVYNPMCPWGIALARMLGRPAATFSTTFVMKPGSDFEQMFSSSDGAQAMTGVWDYVRRSVGELHAAQGTPLLTLGDMFSPDEPLNIVPIIRDFQPDADGFDDRYLFAGPSIRPGRDRAGFPWERLGAGPVLYISLGTAISRGSGARFAQTCFRAFADTPWQVVLATGAGTGADEIGTPPPGFFVHGYVPQLEVLGRADAFVTHGGVNSIMEALWYGVPLVAIPHTIEQLIIADRAVELGLGIRLDPGEVTAAALRDAVGEVTAGPGYRTRLAAISAAARRAGGHRKAADALQHAAAGARALASQRSDDRRSA